MMNKFFEQTHWHMHASAEQFAEFVLSTDLQQHPQDARTGLREYGIRSFFIVPLAKMGGEFGLVLILRGGGRPVPVRGVRSIMWAGTTSAQRTIVDANTGLVRHTCFMDDITLTLLAHARGDGIVVVHEAHDPSF
jgi:hypothetical protein